MNKKLFVIRHAESLGNKENYFQDDLANLTIRGIREAKSSTLGQDIDPDVIYISTTKRASKTAKNIFPNNNIIISKVFNEVRFPSIFNNQVISNLEIEQTLNLYKNFKYDFSGTKFSDEEDSLSALYRACAALLLIQNSPYSRSVLITHGKFMRYLSLAVYFLNNTDETIDSEGIIELLNMRYKNLECIILKYNFKTKKWMFN